MGAAKLKANTTIAQYEEQEVSLRSLEVLPELLQVRSILDKAWSLEYSKGYARGDAFPPILVYRLPDGRLVVTDGFHRIDACLAIGLRSIRAQIREGTIHEALLAAIEANTAAFHRGRPFEEDDRKHAVEMLLADSESSRWSDVLLAERCGIRNSRTVAKIRCEFHKKNGTPLPETVFERGGRERKYRSLFNSPPSVRQRRRSDSSGKIDFYAKLGREHISLGSDRKKAEKKLISVVEERESRRRDTSCYDNLGAYFLRFGLSFDSHFPGASPVYPGVYGRFGYGVVLTWADLRSTKESILLAVGRVLLLREIVGQSGSRMVVVCYQEDGSRGLIEAAGKCGIEFLSPQELVESLNGREGEEEGQG